MSRCHSVRWDTDCRLPAEWRSLLKGDQATWKVFVLLSDGECDEGSIWEAAMFAPFHKLNNLTAIVDYNKIQSFGSIAEVLDLEPFAAKWRAFGWELDRGQWP